MTHAARRGLGVAALLAGVLFGAVPARAADEPVRVLATQVTAPVGEPDPDAEAELGRVARRITAVLREAVQDLGLTLEISEDGAAVEVPSDEGALPDLATEGWVMSARVEAARGGVSVRLTAVAPGSRVVLVRMEVVNPEALDVAVMKMARDLVAQGDGAPPADAPCAPEGAPAEAPRSSGRAVLALNAAALGATVGVSLHRASGDQDNRLVYPLAALGGGIGLGASMLVADEWDVGLGDAWYLSAGAVWPYTAGILLADGYGVSPRQDRYVYGLLGAGAGLGLATLALSRGSVSEGGAALAHSGGVFGVVLGSLAQVGVEGAANGSPTRGMGYGAAIGVVGLGALGTQLEVSASRVLLIDLGATLGALTGAAALSPLVFEDPSPAAERLFVGSVATGALLGAGVAWWMTTAPPPSEEQARRRRGARAQPRATEPAGPTAWPWAGPVLAPRAAPAPAGIPLGERADPGEASRAVPGVGVVGQW